jgi:arginyl-tRNA--protein-N-Asp/Glu arginylyltransferase
MHQPTGLTGPELDDYLARGWYRMQQSIFTITHSFRESVMDFCPVWWLRFPVNGIDPHGSHARIRRRAQHLQVRVQPSFLPDAASEELYGRYLASVPFDGYPSVTDALYGESDPISGTIYETNALIVSDGEKTVAMGIFDTGARAAASILHFYDPEYARFSLGKYLILLTIDELRARGFEWYYPGYVVTGERRFDYKLFLGRDKASYFDPAHQAWRPFREEILQRVEDDTVDWEGGLGDLIF